MQHWLSLGVPKDKLLVGVPLYGRKFLLTDSSNYTLGAPSSGGNFMPFYEVNIFSKLLLLLLLLRVGVNYLLIRHTNITQEHFMLHNIFIHVTHQL